jgi:hypothetical protein
MMAILGTAFAILSLIVYAKKPVVPVKVIAEEGKEFTHVVTKVVPISNDAAVAEN